MKVVCVCGVSVSRSNISKHVKTAKHLNLVEGTESVPLSGFVVCECRASISRSNISKHLKTKLHKKNIVKNGDDYKHLEGIISYLRPINRKHELIGACKAVMVKLLANTARDEDFYSINDKFQLIQIERAS